MRRLKRAGSIIRPECSRASTGPPTRPAFNDRRAAFAVKWLFAPHFKRRMWLCHRPLAGKNLDVILTSVTQTSASTKISRRLVSSSTDRWDSSSTSIWSVRGGPKTPGLY